MLTDRFRFLAPRNIEPRLADCLRSLAVDMERIRNGSSPTAAELERAPTLDRWRAIVTPVGVRLTGRVLGHPRLGDTTALISPLWAADDGDRWVRTLSRFYRLGKPDLGADDRWSELEEPRDV
jgi:hypothetical protein